jgi:hypothetical protein
VSRLGQHYADVHRALAALSALEKQAAVERLVAVSLDANGVSAAIASAPGEVERLDEQAWHVREQAERGTARQEQYEAAFRRARAASAAGLLAAARCDLDEVAYEALHGLPADVEGVPIISG